MILVSYRFALTRMAADMLKGLTHNHHMPFLSAMRLRRCADIAQMMNYGFFSVPGSARRRCGICVSNLIITDLRRLKLSHLVDLALTNAECSA